MFYMKRKIFKSSILCCHVILAIYIDIGHLVCAMHIILCENCAFTNRIENLFNRKRSFRSKVATIPTYSSFEQINQRSQPNSAKINDAEYDKTRYLLLSLIFLKSKCQLFFKSIDCMFVGIKWFSKWPQTPYTYIQKSARFNELLSFTKRRENLRSEHFTGRENHGIRCLRGF